MNRNTINEQIKHIEAQEKNDMNRSILSSLNALKTKIDCPKDYYVVVMGKDTIREFHEFRGNKL